MADILRRHVLLLTVAAVLFSTVPVSNSIPFIVLHGLGNKCDGGVSNFTTLLSTLSGSPGSCLEIGHGSKDSWFMPLTLQARLACKKVKNMTELSQGYNIVAESQGNMVARGGPHAGVAAAPNKWCHIGVYNDFVQDHIAPSGFVKIPDEKTKYLEHSKYLPKLNNERPDQRNSTFKDRFASLHNLVLVMFLNDTILVPRETSWFGFIVDGGVDTIAVAQLTALYIEDWIGLKALDDAGKVKFVSVPGDHLMIGFDDTVKYVVPYLK
ncbi:alpha/beta-Hydrolases superfamily protein [Raphanus sativus]|nr:alpha/beta-Hydrolases superfamily protein [Raphanus sativus]